MVIYQTATDEEKREIFDTACHWFHDHSYHVAGLVKDKGANVAPVGSDLFRPELWKDIHWRWFFSLKD